jgi:LacI family transcriptional regulator
MKVTIVDIASLANVSPTTVSRALKNDSRITSEVRKRVRALAQELGYRPNLLARGLVSSRTHAIGYVVDNLSWSFYSELAESVQTAAETVKYGSYIYSSLKHPENERRGIESLLSRGVDGLLISPTEAAENVAILRDLLAQNFPMVLLGDVDDLEADAVVIDNFSGAHKAMDHLHKLGHRRIAYIGPAENGNVKKQRMGGYHNFIHRHQLDDSLTFCNENDPLYGYRVVLEAMRTDRRPTAIFAHNDTLAFGVYRALYEMGYRIPDDVSVVGYDDLPSCEFMYPPLTSIGTSLKDLARIAVGLLMERIERLNTPLSAVALSASRQRISLTPKLVVRRSTATPNLFNHSPLNRRDNPT